MNRGVLLQRLPPFSNVSVTIRKNQTVGDIVEEVCQAHEIFAPDYDSIALDFNYSTALDTAKALFNFLKLNVRYKVESEENQTTKSPAAIIETGHGDCKHYAGFIAGVLDALKRQGKKVEWNYRFASYNFFDSLPQHVFVVLHEGGKEYWIDPVLKTFNEKLQPTYILDKVPKSKYMLQRLSGIEDTAAIDYYDEDDSELSPEIINAITILYQYGVLNAEGQVNDNLIIELSKSLPTDEFEKIAQARILLHDASIGGFFSGIWKGVKKVTLTVPRNAYLSLVALNAFGYATKLANALYKLDGSYYNPGKDKLKKKWEGFGGSFSKLENAIKSGSKKKAILGEVYQSQSVGAIQLTAILTAATPIIKAISDFLKQILPQKASEGQLPGDIDPNTGLKFGMNDTSGNSIMDFVQQNPLVVAALAAAGIYFFTNRKKRA